MNELNKHKEVIQYIVPQKEKFIDSSELRVIEYGYIVGMAYMQSKELIEAVCILADSINGVSQNEATVKLLPYNLKLLAIALNDQGHTKAAMTSFFQAIEMINQ